MECYDLRARASVGRLDAATAAGAPPGSQLTALRFDDAGMQVAVGTSSGLVALYDLRSSRPYLVKDHMYGDPIRDIKWHSGGGGRGAGALCARRVVSADAHAVKVRRRRGAQRARGRGGMEHKSGHRMLQAVGCVPPLETPPRHCNATTKTTPQQPQHQPITSDLGRDERRGLHDNRAA